MSRRAGGSRRQRRGAEEPADLAVEQDIADGLAREGDEQHEQHPRQGAERRREVEIDGDGNQVVAAVPLLPLVSVGLAPEADDPQVREVQGGGHHVGERVLLGGDLDLGLVSGSQRERVDAVDDVREDGDAVAVGSGSPHQIRAPVKSGWKV